MFQATKQIIFKVTRGCNLRCSYCYVFNKDKFIGEFMPFDLYTKILERVFSETRYGNLLEEGEDRVQDAINIVFHGGEPTSIGKENFMRYAKIAHQLARRYNKVLNLSIQTNGTLIDDEWIAMFRKYKVSPGISLDGFLDQSDSERNAGGKLIETLLRMKGANMIDSVLMVLHKSNYKNIEKNLNILHSIGIKSAKINRGVDVTTTGESKYELNAKDLFETYKKIFYFMISHPNFAEDNLLQWMEKYLTETSKGVEGKDYGMHCYTRYCGAGSALIEIEPDGNIQFCGRNSTFSEFTSSGNALTRDVAEINHVGRAFLFHREKLNSIVERGCNLCHAQAICDGGCISFSQQKFGKAIIDPTTCALNKMMHTFLSNQDLKVREYMKERNIPSESNNYFCL